jgi:CubicO group peptidase (beta-lactamase class C family)
MRHLPLHAACASAFLSASALMAQDLSALDRVIPRMMRQHGVPGVALSIVRHDSIVALKGYGYARLRKGDSARVVAERTVFRVASIAKLFVATAVMQQVERGTLELDADVNRYLAWRVPTEWPEPITLHALLTHTAGFDERMIGYAAPSPDSVVDLGAHLRENLPHRGWPPGAVIGYSNYGFALAAHVVERAMGMPFHDYARAWIFGPLGMRHTSYIRVPDSLAANVADGHLCASGRCRASPVVYSRPYPAGLAYSTASDMARFMIAHLGGGLAAGERVLERPSIETLQRQHFTADSATAGISYAFFNQRHLGHRALAHAGNVTGFNNLLVLLPDARVGLYVVTNGGRTAFGAAIRDTLLRLLVTRAPALPPRAPAIALNEAYLRSLAGNYQITRYAHRTIEKFPSLFVSSVAVRVERGRLVWPFGGNSLECEPLDSLRFREKGGDRTIAFRRAASGRVTHLAAPIPIFGAEMPAVLERRSPYDSAYFMNELVSWLAMLPLIIMALLWPLAWGVAAWGRKKAGLTPRRSRWTAPLLAAAVAFTALWLWFGFGFIARSVRMFESGTGIVYGVSPQMRAFALVPWLLAALAAAVLAGAVVSWRRGWWDWPRRMLLSAFAVCALCVVTFLARWNYLPPTF